MSELGAKLIKRVRKVAKKYPEKVYYSQSGDGHCEYVTKGGPGCLVGQALWDLGLINADFEKDPANSAGIYGMEKRLGLGLSEIEYDWLIEAQSQQDLKKTWGEAVASANRARTDV